jgi:hypothetical protein
MLGVPNLKFERIASDWSLVEASTESLADRLGKPIDESKFDAVTALRAYGFSTSASCGGHLQHGRDYPWIDIGVTPIPPKDAKSWREDNLRQQAMLLQLLTEFYSEHNVPADLCLVLIPAGIYSGFTIRNGGADVHGLKKSDLRRKQLERFQKEFKAFSQFLKRKTFKSNKRSSER